MTDLSTEVSILLRLGAATLIGAVIGLNRDLRGKPTGGPLEAWLHRIWGRDDS